MTARAVLEAATEYASRDYVKGSKYGIQFLLSDILLPKLIGLTNTCPQVASWSYLRLRSKKTKEGGFKLSAVLKALA